MMRVNRAYPRQKKSQIDISTQSHLVFSCQDNTLTYITILLIALIWINI